MEAVVSHVANNTEHIVRDFSQSSREVITGATYAVGSFVRCLIILVLGYVISMICRLFKQDEIVIRTPARYTAQSDDMVRRLKDAENAIQVLTESMEKEKSKNEANEVELRSKIAEGMKDRENDVKTIEELTEGIEILKNEKEEIQANEHLIQSRIDEFEHAREEDAKEIKRLMQTVEDLEVKSKSSDLEDAK